MARIEDRGPINPSISSRVDVYTPNVSQAGATERAQSDLGMQVAGIGMQIADRVKKTKDNDYAFDSTVEDHQKISEFQADDYLKNGADGHAERVKAYITKTQDDRTAKAPSADAADLYHKKTANMFVEYDLKAQQQQIEGVAKKSRDGLQNQADASAKALLRVPDPKTFYESQKLFNERVDESVGGGTINPDDADKFKKQYAQTGAKSLFDGYLAKGDAGLDTGSRLLKDKALTENLSVDALDWFQKSYKSGTEARDTQRFGEAKNFMNDVIADVSAGNQVDPKLMSQAMGVLNSNKHKNPYEIERIQNEFRVASVVSQATSDIKNYPISEWGKRSQETIASIRGKDKTWGAKEEIMYQSMYANQVKKLLDQTQKDAHGYAISANPELKQLAMQAGSDPSLNRQLQEKSLAFQEQAGIAPEDRKVASPAEADQWGSAIMATKNADQAGQVLAQIQQRYGPRAPMFMNQMVKEHKDLAGFEIAGYLDGNARTAAIDSLLEKEKYAKAFDSSYPGQGASLTGLVNKKTEDIRSAILTGNNDRAKVGMANNFKELVELDVKRVMARGSTKSMKDVVDDSYDRLYKQFDTIKAGRSNILTSKNSYGSSSKEDVTNWIDHHSGSGIASLEPQPPKEYMTSFTTPYGNTTDSIKRAKENWHGVLKDHSRWVGNQSQDGAYLVFDDGVNTPRPLFNPKGKLVEMKFKDMKSHDVEASKQNQMANKPNAPLGFFGGF